MRELSSQRRALLSARSRKGLALLLALGLAAWAVDFLLADTSWPSLEAALRHQQAHEMLASFALAVVSFACLASYDAIALDVVAKGRVPRRIALMAGATASAIANTLGFHALTGSAVRLHVYVPAGLRAAEIARIVSLSWLSLGAGNLAMLAGAELVQAAVSREFGWPLATGGVLVAVLILFVAWLARGPRTLVIGAVRLPMPSASLAVALMVIGAAESATAIGALYVLLPPDLAPAFSLFAVACIASVALGVVAHTPGGIGVFEASLTALLSGRGRPDLLAALLVYRLVYNVLPFLLSVLVLGLRVVMKRVREG